LFGKTKETGKVMAKETNAVQSSRDNVISIIGPGMKVTGDCETDGTLRIEGTVEGTVRAGKAVVVGKDGSVLGDVVTQDAIIGGRVSGKVVAESRLELQSTCIVDGEIRARRIKLDEGGRLNGQVNIGEIKADQPGTSRIAGPGGSPAAGQEKLSAGSPGAPGS
jgi:cytoskeletal protein CcmA (bactofilin family)